MLISGVRFFYIIFFWGLGSESGVKAFGGDGSIYLGMGVKKTPIEFIDVWDISDGDRTFTGVALSSDGYEGNSRYFDSADSYGTKGRTANRRRTIALRSELWKFMRFDRIARPVALYGAPVSARTSATIAEAIVNPIDFEEVPDGDMDKVLGAESYSHMHGFGGPDRHFRRGESR